MTKLKANTCLQSNDLIVGLYINLQKAAGKDEKATETKEKSHKKKKSGGKDKQVSTPEVLEVLDHI